MNRLWLCLPMAVLAAAAIAACGDGPDPEPTPTPTQTATATPTRAVVAPTLAPGTPVVLENPTTTTSGLKYVDEVVGEGRAPKATSQVVVNYTGRFAANGQVFDSSEGKGPAQFAVGGVIPGFSEAILGMKEGGKRTVFIPSKLGYGPGGYPPRIPPNTDLVFDIELVRVLD
ncbi:MAG: FKBP-type peptidyl-prolyl cis-trans isomerase [Hyphomicrobiales bacterium]